MARGTLTPQVTSRTGLAASYTAADQSDGHQFAWDDRRFLHVKNAGENPTTVTIPTPGTIDGGAIPDKQVTVAAGAEKFIGPFSKSLYKQEDGYVYVDVSEETDVTLAVVELGSAGY